MLGAEHILEEIEQEEIDREFDRAMDMRRMGESRMRLAGRRPIPSSDIRNFITMRPSE